MAAETPRSPYRLYWSFPDNEMSAIDVDRGDLSASRFETDYDLVRYLAAQTKSTKKVAAPIGTLMKKIQRQL